MKFIIDNNTELNDSLMFQLVYEVIKMGYVSNYDTEYCYVSRFKVGLDESSKCLFADVIFSKTNYGYKVLLIDGKGEWYG